MNQSTSEIIGRKKELRTLQAALESNSASFLALYGRRRVGKTFLVRKFFEKSNCKTFIVSGQNNGKIGRQLGLFKQALEKCFYDRAPLPDLVDWNGAFTQLIAALKQSISKDPTINHLVFLDELPWLYTTKSGLLEAIDHAWNSELSLLPQVKLIVCGSAASWMIKNIVRAKGGLHNRLTDRISLQPFKLDEVKDFLESKGIYYSNEHLIDTYMFFGGVPYYLNFIRKGESPSQAVSRLCFAAGPLNDEFDILFKALFQNGEVHEKIVRNLASKRRGLTRSELLEKVGKNSGGSFNTRLKELEEAGFITQVMGVTGNKDATFYRVIDEFVLFHLRWIDKAGKGILRQNDDYFVLEHGSHEYETWSGFAFENVIFQHLEKVKEALGLSKLKTWAYTWETGKLKDRKGAQIDLVVERDDGMINVCEIKYYENIFTISKSYAEILKSKVESFKEHTATKKSISLTIIAPRGLANNEYAKQLVSKSINSDDILN